MAYKHIFSPGDNGFQESLPNNHYITYRITTDKKLLIPNLDTKHMFTISEERKRNPLDHAYFVRHYLKVIVVTFLGSK